LTIRYVAIQNINFILRTSAVITDTNSNTVARKRFSFRSKTITEHGEIRNFFLATVFEFVYVINALVVSFIHTI
jgi:hypothetical protein